VHRRASARRAVTRTLTRSKRLIRPSRLSAHAREAFARRHIILVDRERARIGADRLLLVAETLIGEAAAHPGLQAAGCVLDRLVEVARRRFEVVDGDV